MNRIFNFLVIFNDFFLIVPEHYKHFAIDSNSRHSSGAKKQQFETARMGRVHFSRQNVHIESSRNEIVHGNTVYETHQRWPADNGNC